MLEDYPADLWITRFWVWLMVSGFFLGFDFFKSYSGFARLRSYCVDKICLAFYSMISNAL